MRGRNAVIPIARVSASSGFRQANAALQGEPMSALLKQLNDDLSDVVVVVRRSLVQVLDGHGGAGAGTIWHSDGLIVTNAHVIAQGGGIRVTLPDGRTFPATVLA